MNKKIRNIPFNAFALLVILLTVFASGCNTTKYLTGDETLLKKNRIVVLDDVPKNEKKWIKTNLGFFYKQIPNGKKFGVSREYFFYKNNDAKDTTKINKWARETLGQPPVIFYHESSVESVRLMEQYLKNKKGYYHAQVDYIEDNKNGKTTVSYLVKPGDRYSIKSIKYISEDTTILDKIESIKSESLIKVGDPIDSDIFESEGRRITYAMQNQGYADFFIQYLDVKGDSIGKGNMVDIFIEIFPPEGKNSHTIYKTGNISVYTDHYNKQDTISINSSTLNGINYYTESTKYLVKPKVLEKAIFFTPGDFSRRAPRLQSYRKLSTLSAYRFSSIYPSVNTSDSTLIDYSIFLTPHNKKWIADGGFDVYYSNEARFGNLLGLSFNGQLIDRNFLGGSEQYTLSAGVGTELTIASGPVIARTFTTSINNSLELPIFLDPFKTFRGLNKLHILPDREYNIFINNAKTELNLGANLTRVKEYLSIKTIGGSIGYNYSNGLSHQLSINQLSLSLNDYQLNGFFNPLNVKSFQDNLLTGFIFSDLLYVYNKKSNTSNRTYGLLTNFETSGLEVYFANKIYNGVSGNDKSWTLGKNRFEFAKYVKFDVDGRINFGIGKNKNFVSRAFFGIIVPYGDNTANPYTKQFNVGGPNSLRGWRQRELGPGSFKNQIIDTTFIQQADLKMEANLEYRFDLGSIVEGAFFLDAGNIWRLNDKAESGGGISSNFYKQIAVAGGYGIRLDFEYFIIRFDFGYKLRNPYKNETTGKYWYKWKDIKKQKIGNVQIAINYPF